MRDHQLRPEMLLQCRRVVVHHRTTIDANAAADAIEADEQQADVGVLADVAERAVHRVAVVLRVPEVILDAMTEIKTNFVKGKLDIVTEDTERLSGRPPKALRDILAASLA